MINRVKSSAKLKIQEAESPIVEKGFILMTDKPVSFSPGLLNYLPSLLPMRGRDRIVLRKQKPTYHPGI